MNVLVDLAADKRNGREKSQRFLDHQLEVAEIVQMFDRRWGGFVLAEHVTDLLEALALNFGMACDVEEGERDA